MSKKDRKIKKLKKRVRKLKHDRNGWKDHAADLAQRLQDARRVGRRWKCVVCNRMVSKAKVTVRATNTARGSGPCEHCGGLRPVKLTEMEKGR